MNDPVVIASLVQGTFAIIATVIAAFTASTIGKRFSKQESIKQNLETAKKDIEFLLAVEEVHCSIHKGDSSSSKRNTVRDKV